MIKPISFDHDGVTVTNPFRSSCGTLEVDPVEEYGFKILKSSSGIASLVKNIADENVILLNDALGFGVPTNAGDCTILLLYFEGNKIRTHKLRGQLGSPEARAVR